MKTRLLIIIGILLSLGLTGTAFATHDPTYNHPTPFELQPETQEEKPPVPEPEPFYYENIDKEKPCGLGTTYQDGICIVNQTENVNSNSSYKWEASYNVLSIDETALCGEGTELIDNQCVPIEVKAVSQPTGGDAPFFGIFVYLDNLISWIFG